MILYIYYDNYMNVYMN